MPKIQKLRKFRTAAKQASDQYLGSSNTAAAPTAEAAGTDQKSASSAASLGVSGQESLSKGQKKRRQKRASLMVKLGMISPDLKFSAATAKKEKKDAFNALLSELESSLPAANDVIRPAAAVSVRTNKLKKTLAVRETARMQLVQQHPAFVQDPLAAVTKHIQHMLAMKAGAK